MRYIIDLIEEYSPEKFVLLSGPRQVGKTTLAKNWLGETPSIYLNWDIPRDRARILDRSFLNDGLPSKLVLDEIHKYKRWKNYLKGLFDEYQRAMQVVVTGSAKLDIYQKGGDSLFGRYERVRLHPYSVGELMHGRPTEPPSDWLVPDAEGPINQGSDAVELWSRLERFSGFPEPYSKQNKRQLNRWSIRRRELLLQQEVRDISEVRQLSLLEHLYLLLPTRVGAPLSINGLRLELDVAHGTLSNWLNVLERLYVCFRVHPYTGKLSRSIKKEAKLYLWNWADLVEPSARFENMVASHLLKAVQLWNDMGYGEYDVHYWRNKEKQEIDFIVTESGTPKVAVECKQSVKGISREMHAFGKSLKKKSRASIPLIQLVAMPGVDIRGKGIRTVTASKYLSGLP